MEQQFSLRVQPRTVYGKKVRFLRREGQIPANVYGPGLDSIAVQVDEKELRQLLRAAGQHHLVHLKVGAEPKTRQVLMRRIEQDSITDAILHVDFYQVAMDKKLTSRVPLVLLGEDVAAPSGGVVLQVLDHVTVTSLPQDLPAAITVDISGLRSLDATVRVQDLVPPPNVDILTGGDELVVKIQRPRLLKKAEEEAEGIAEGEEAAPGPAED